ncbi:DNA-processing protein DprA [Rhodospirillaceae bacterium SYSU D60014]|uniref:DNA-processing protein DprA n=1 Tax=Virgifigura deserti TaxID=2268457 RepID=UPI000E672435
MLMPRRPLTDEEMVDWLRLIRSDGVGPVTFRELLGYFGTAAAALDALPDLARRGGRRAPLRLCPRDAAEREIETLTRIGGRFLASAEPGYPEALAAVDDAPPVLSLLGDAGLLARPAVAVVGARNASANGRKLAEDIARDLSETGLVVVSGLARGIDTAAHKGSLAGGTVAVLAGGVDVPFPPENEGLYREIAAHGLVVAEQPPGTRPLARHFPRRNRVISGLSLGVLVVEAAPRSGSLITARFALEQGREVMAVPGSPLDPRCRGTNHLLRQGAVLTESAADVLEALKDMLSADRPPQPLPGLLTEWLAPDFDGSMNGRAGATPADSALDAARAELETQLGATPVKVDELLRRCQLSGPVLRTALLEMELAGRLERHPGNKVSLLFN